MKRLGPLLRMTLALVALCGTLVMLADLFFGVLPDRAAQTRVFRKNVGEALAVQVAALLEGDDQRTLQRTLTEVAARTESVLSLGIRRSDGKLVMQAGDHQKAWRVAEDDRSQADQLSVALSANGQRWGTFEIVFKGRSGHLAWQWLSEPMVVMLLFLSSVGTLVFGLYMRRALQHLDPASVIPERVQGAFDAMAEGVVVLDTRGRVMLANKSFRGLHADAGALRLGHSLSLLPWLAGALPKDLSTHAWARAMAERASSAGQTLEVADGEQGARRLVVNCAPVTDPGGSVRGCLVTFNDVSELHRTNQTLLLTLNELSLAKDEVQRKNTELEQLATRDPMTGCLNRRAFNEALESMFRRARTGGQPLGCVMLDIDHFKKVNDNFGHAVGDRVIQEVAKQLHDSSRAGDLVCRYGGEEFCIVVPGLDLAQTMALAERVRVKVERDCAAALHDVEGLHVAISLGVDVLSSQVPSPAALIDRADQGLYRAKRSGRNRVCAFVPDTVALQSAVAPGRGALDASPDRRDGSQAEVGSAGRAGDVMSGTELLQSWNQ
jgi:diguanylate cyclase (GGDEF)-like protein